MKIVYWPADILKRVSEVVTEPVDDLFLADMRATMVSHSGAGLSAVQVGGLKRIVITDRVADHPSVFVNPVIKGFRGSKSPKSEGCLSVPGFFEYIMRYPEIVVTYQDADLTLHEDVVFTGFMAHVLQHECEHLDGKMYLDYLPAAKRSTLMGNMMALKQAGKLR